LNARSCTTRKIGFRFDDPREGFYAIGYLNGLEVHLKEAPKNQADRQWRRDHEHLDAAAESTALKRSMNSALPTG
jgi:hypothetical protein